MSWSAQIEGAEHLPEEMRQAWREGAHSGMEVLGVEGQRMVVNNITTPFQGPFRMLPPAVFTGNLAASISFEVLEDQGVTRLIVGTGTALKVNEYAPSVETGARPHMPPASALVPWVVKKFGIDDEKKAFSAAFAIARKIARRGTAGHQMFSRALTSLEEVAPRVIENSIAQAMARLNAGGAA